MKKIILTFFITAILFSIWHNHSLNKEKALTEANKEQSERIITIERDNLKQKIETLKQEVVEDIRKCESAGLGEDYALITFDPQQSKRTSCSQIGARNKVCFSFGEFQFKSTTVQYYSKKLRGEKLTSKEAITLALNTSEAAKLAEEVIFDEVGGYRNWLNCGKKIGAYDRITMIRTLME